METESDWVIELERELKQGVRNSGHSSSVFSVASAFLASDQQYYIPRFISVGPYHFGKAKLRSMEPHKTEAVRRMQERGPKMESFVRKEIMQMAEIIKEFYDKELSYSAIDLAWMVTKDSCFFFEFMFTYFRTHTGKSKFHDEWVVKGSHDTLFSSSLKNPTRKNIFYDLALFENQIPLSVLQRVLAAAVSKSNTDLILGEILNGVAAIQINMVFGWGMLKPYNKNKTSHFLEVLYYRHVGWDLACYREEACSVNDERWMYFDWAKSIFTSCYPNWIRGKGVENRVLPFKGKLPAAAELKKKQVNLCAVTTRNTEGVKNPYAIRWVRFEEKTSTLYLPEVHIDHFRHALLRNFIALEYTTEKYRPAPITTFTFFMDELVDGEEDVAVLREANIIKNFIGSNKEVAQCFNSLTRIYYEAEGCKPIDDARVGLHKYLRKKKKILWNEFLSTKFPKPWSVIGLVAAMLLLGLTAIQVFCLFFTCSRSK